MTQKFLCPMCSREYEREGKVVQDHVICSCCFDFWVYVRQSMCITAPWGDRRTLMLVDTLERMERGNDRRGRTASVRYSGAEIRGWCWRLS